MREGCVGVREGFVRRPGLSLGAEGVPSGGSWSVAAPLAVLLEAEGLYGGQGSLPGGISVAPSPGAVYRRLPPSLFAIHRLLAGVKCAQNVFTHTGGGCAVKAAENLICGSSARAHDRKSI